MNNELHICHQCFCEDCDRNALINIIILIRQVHVMNDTCVGKFYIAP